MVELCDEVVAAGIPSLDMRAKKHDAWVFLNFSAFREVEFSWAESPISAVTTLGFRAY